MARAMRLESVLVGKPGIGRGDGAGLPGAVGLHRAGRRTILVVVREAEGSTTSFAPETLQCFQDAQDQFGNVQTLKCFC